MSNRCHDTTRTGVMSHPHPRGVTLTLGGRHHPQSQSKIPSPTPNFTMAITRPVGPPTHPASTAAAPPPSIHKCSSTARKSNAEYPRVIAHTPTGKTVLKGQAGRNFTQLTRRNGHADLQANLYPTRGGRPPGACLDELRTGWKIWPSNTWSKYCECGKERPRISRSGHRIRLLPSVLRSGCPNFYI